jgi:hypothetical protein
VNERQDWGKLYAAGKGNKWGGSGPAAFRLTCRRETTDSGWEADRRLCSNRSRKLTLSNNVRQVRD